MRPLMPPVQTPDNLFHDGNPLTGELGTVVDASHLNNVQGSIRDVQAELISILTAANMQPDSVTGQFLEAIKKLTLARENPGSDIKSDGNIDVFLKNIGLQTILKVGDFGLGSRDLQSAASNEHVSRFFFENFQPGTLYPESVVAIQSGGPSPEEWGQVAVSYGAALRVFAAHKSYSGQPETTELFHDKRKPTNADVGSYPATGGVLAGNMMADGNVTSGQDKDISSGRDIWATRDIYAQRNLSVTAGASVGLDLTVGRNLGTTGNIDAGGYIRSGAGKDVVSQNDIWASRYIYENGQRVYGPNNPPPAKFSKSLNTISWEKNLETGVIRQWGFVDAGDNGFVSITLPVAFPSSFLSLNVTPRCNGAVMGADIVSAHGQILSNNSFGVGISANFQGGYSGVYFEAIGV
ncbi:TPA: hypothetical protein MPJ72_001829 [Enterobacter asburiae]|nr:hypothetical protein [Enterobacter asburiae]HCA3849527.1 hypothetical protein [Enterobacter asburiae]HDS9624461.1 hypothetical protein [Enterobacter asburiae]HDT1961180.1 hypothetical protein [Enterobacter asburiae]